MSDKSKIQSQQNSTNVDKAALLVALDQNAIVSETDAKGNFIYVNDKFVEVTKYSRAELMGQNHRILKSGEQPQHLFEDLWQTISSGRVWRGEIKNRAKDGTYYWVDASMVPILGSKGKPERYISVQFLITNKKDAELSMIKKNFGAQATAIDLEKFKIVLDGISDHVVITDPNGQVLYANTSVKKITGFSPEEIIGKKAGTRELWGGEMGKEFYKKMWHTIKIDKKPFTGEITNKRKNGVQYQALLSISPILSSAGKLEYFVGIERDITIDKRYEDHLREYKAIIQDTEEAIISKDLEGKVVSWNKGAEKVYGYTEAEMINQSIRKIVPPENDDVAAILKMIKEGVRIPTYTTVRKRKDGSLIDVQLTVSPMTGEHGEVIGASVIARDITKEKEIDKAKTEFVSLASHQLRTPLSAVNWYAELLFDKITGTLNAKQKSYLREIYAGNQRMIALVNTLLNVSRLELGTFEIDPKVVNPSRIIDELVKELHLKIVQGHLTIKRNVQKEPKRYRADPDLFGMIIQNLISNAVKYTPKNGTINIEMYFIKNSLKLVVKDNGRGIPTSQKDKIFSKLFRADNVRALDIEGTGLGLYIVKSIVDQCGGKISFTSQLNKGTTFEVTLPRAGMAKRDGTKKLG